MNPDSMDVKSTMFLPNSTIATGQLCPDQRRMPQIVSIFFICCVPHDILMSPLTGLAVCRNVCNAFSGNKAPHCGGCLSPRDTGLAHRTLLPRQQKSQPVDELWPRAIQSGGVFQVGVRMQRSFLAYISQSREFPLARIRTDIYQWDDRSG